jgi:hypothetical protein
VSRQGLAFARLGPQGLMWHTIRLSWDGFDQIVIDQSDLRDLAWSPLDDKWCPFSVELGTGKSAGGSFSQADTEGWECWLLTLWPVNRDFVEVGFLPPDGSSHLDETPFFDRFGFTCR